MNDNHFIPSDDEEALYKPPKKLCENMSPYLKVLPEFNELPESEDEDLQQMAKDLDDWRTAKIKEEYTKLKTQHIKEWEAEEEEQDKQLKLLEEKLETRKANREKLKQLSNNMEKVVVKMAKEKGIDLVELDPIQAKIDKKLEEEKEKERIRLAQEKAEKEAEEMRKRAEEFEKEEARMKEERGSEHTSLNLEEQESNSGKLSEDRMEDVDPEEKQRQQEIDNIPLADSPSRQQQLKGPRLEPPKDKKKDDEPLIRPNLCPDVKYSGSKKFKRNAVKEWLNNIGKDGPPLPVPEENYYPDYADPNTANALQEIEDLQAAYDAERNRKGRKDGKVLEKITGEDVFNMPDEEADILAREEANNQSVANRMLSKMLARNGDKPLPPQPKVTPDTTKYTDNKTYGPQVLPGGLAYERKPGMKGEVKLPANIKKEAPTTGQVLASKLTITGNINSSGGNLPVTRIPALTDRAAMREKMKQTEAEMRAKAIKAMMEKM